MKIRVRVGTSRISGLGLFAGQDIKQGTKIIRYIGEKITHEESDRRLGGSPEQIDRWSLNNPHRQGCEESNWSTYFG